jgi:hypothetical protein
MSNSNPGPESHAHLHMHSTHTEFAPDYKLTLLQVHSVLINARCFERALCESLGCRYNLLLEQVNTSTAEK